MELQWLGGVFAGTVRPTVPRLVGERFVPCVRVADGGHGVAAERQTHVQGEPGPEQPIVREPSVQAAEDRDQHDGQRFQRHVMRTDAFPVSRTAAACPSNLRVGICKFVLFVFRGHWQGSFAYWRKKAVLRS